MKKLPNLTSLPDIPKWLEHIAVRCFVATIVPLFVTTGTQLTSRVEALRGVSIFSFFAIFAHEHCHRVGLEALKLISRNPAIKRINVRVESRHPRYLPSQFRLAPSMMVLDYKRLAS